MAALYRKSSLEKLSNPEQLDKAIVISSPMSWLALIGVAVMIIAIVIWSIFGTIPTTMMVEGVIVNPINVGAIYSEQSGKVKKINVETGDMFYVGTTIATIELGNGEEYNICATTSGTVSEILVSDNVLNHEYSGGQEKLSQVYPGTEIIRYTPELKSKQAVICYVPLVTAKQYKEGMEVVVSPLSVNSQEYGRMSATIVNVGNYPASANNLSYVFGASDNYVAARLMENGPVVPIICEMELDSSTISGYKWSNKKGANVSLSNGTFVTAQIVTDRTAPITKMISGLKEKMEGQ